MEPATANELITAPQATRELVFHGPLGEAELGSDFFLREGFELPEHHNFPAAGRQRRQDICKHADLFLVTERVSRIGLLFQDGKRGEIPHENLARGLGSLDGVEGEVAGDGEKKSFRRADGPCRLGAPHAKIGFLHYIINVPDGGKTTAQIGAQLRLVGMNLLREPSRSRRLGSADLVQRSWGRFHLIGEIAQRHHGSPFRREARDGA